VVVSHAAWPDKRHIKRITKMFVCSAIMLIISVEYCHRI